MQTIQQNEAILTEFLTKGASFGGESDQSERSLMEMAYAVLVDRARPLMRDPFRLGFEVVYSNEDSTKMVGIFVFRVGKNIFYIPVFYRNGRVRGLHTIYDCRRKKVKPLTMEWCERLVSTSIHRDGKQVDQSLRNKYGSGGAFRNSDSFRGSALSGGTIKVASVKEVLGDEPFDWIEALRMPVSDYVPGNTLRKVACDIGMPAAVALRDAAASSEDFLYGLSALTGDVPAFFRSLDMRKHASAVPATSAPVEIIPLAHPDFAKTAAHTLSENELTQARQRGWAVLDNRPLDKRAALLADLPSGQVVTEAGEYDIIFEDGKTRKCIVLITPYAGSGKLRSASRGDLSDDGYPETCCNPSGYQDMTTEFFVIDKETREVIMRRRRLYTTTAGNACLEVEGENEMAVGKVYAVVNKNQGRVDGIFHCAEKNSDARLTTYTGTLETYLRSNHDLRLHTRREPHVLIQNAAAKTSMPAQGGLGPDYTFLPLASVIISPDEQRGECGNSYSEVKTCPIMPVDAMSNGALLLRNFKDVDAAAYTVTTQKPSNTVKVSVDRIVPATYDSGSLQKNATASVDLISRTSLGPYNSMPAAAAALMLHSGLSWDDAQQVTANGGAIVKRASLVEQPALPDWTTGWDGAHGVAVEEVRKYVVPVDSPEYQPEDILSSRLGDREGRKDVPNLLVATPSELFEFSRTNDVKSLFEHSAVTQLVKTYNVGNIIDDYLPELESALDRLGRILILLHWKPAEVSEIYGVEDTVTLEDKLLSGFLNLGEIYLELDTRIRGAASEDD